MPGMVLDRLQDVLSYEPTSGGFYWKRSPRFNVPAKARAGTENKAGYRKIVVDGKSYTEHRLVWLFETGAFPSKGLQIDHINGDRKDNRISNLRLATRSQNMANSKPRNKYGLKGINFNPLSKRWFARVNLGTFDTKEEAHAAYTKAAKLIYGEFARTT